MNPLKILAVILLGILITLGLMVYFFLPAREQKRIRGVWWESDAPGLDN